MTSMTLDLPRRFPQPTLLSVRTHGAVVAGLLYTSVHQVVGLPVLTQSISVMMVTPANPEPPQVVQPPPEPIIESEPKPKPIPRSPKEAPVVIEKSKPKPKPKPKSVKKVQEQPKYGVRSVELRPASPFEDTVSARLTLSTAAAATSEPVTSVASESRASSCNQSQHPTRAQALCIEGQAKIKFDVTPGDRVGNAQVLSVKSANVFGYEVKNTMHKWRYEPDRPSSRVVVNILLKVNGTTEIQ